MRPLTFEAYKLLYVITGAKKFSYYMALVLMAILHVLVLSGLAKLLQDVSPTKYIMIIFKKPYYVLTGLVLLWINWRRVPYNTMYVVNKLNMNYTKLMLYTLVAVLIFAYNYLEGKVF